MGSLSGAGHDARVAAATPRPPAKRGDATGTKQATALKWPPDAGNLEMKRSLYSIAAVLVLAIAGGVIYLNAGRTAAPQSTFVLLDGSRESTADFHGKVTLVNFWATSCTTCIAEMPQIAATYDRFKSKGFDTIAVAMSYDQPSYVVNYSETRKLPFKVAIDNTGTVAKAWGDVQLTPTSYLVDKHGEIVKRYVGAPDFADLHRLIEKLLAET
jgi:peroxiredoxin